MKRAERQRRIAEVLYDTLSGRGGYDPMLAKLETEMAARDRRPEVAQLLREAQYVGYSLVPTVGDRWGLSMELARMVVDII